MINRTEKISVVLNCLFICLFPLFFLYARRYVMRTVATCYVNKVMCTPPQRHMSYLVHDIVIRTCTYMIVKFILHCCIRFCY